MANNKTLGRLFVSLFFVFIVLIIVGGYLSYQWIYKANTKNIEEAFLYIPHEATFDQVLDSIETKHLIKNKASFVRIAQIKKYPENIKSGRFSIMPHMSNNALINRLRSGQQAPVRFVINNVRTKDDLAKKTSEQLELDSLTVAVALKSPDVAQKYGFNRESFIAMFLANTYQIYWNTSLEQYFDRMHSEYERFWTAERVEKAKQLGLSPIEVITLASIVEEETKKANELPMVAELYLNRLRIGMPLQADPTVKYAVGDFSIRRVLNKHLTVDSPYNTYKYTGLPPGPIRIPELSAVKAVLNPANHDYLYMAAKEDFSGYHNFARTLHEHNNNADRYRRALTERGIMK